MTDPRTILYRGYEIDPLHDPEEAGAWTLCTVEEATCFRPYPPDINEWALDAEYTLEAAKAAVDADLAERALA